MKIPSNHTEAEVLQIIEKIVKILCKSFVFGYYTLEDIQQTARLFAIQGLEGYDESRPLSGFLYCHVKNRLINLKRDKLHRADPPCLLCNNKDKGKTGHPDGQYCRKFVSWLRRNSDKQKIMNILPFSSSPQSPLIYNKHLDDIEIKEIVNLIYQRLSPELRQWYQLMKEGMVIPDNYKEEIMIIIKGVLCKSGVKVDSL